MKTSTILKKNNRAYILSILFWLLIWQIGSVVLNQEILLVSPISAIKRLIQLITEMGFWNSIFFSFIKITMGFTLAFFIGTILAIIAANKKPFQILIDPLLYTIQAIPVASFIILCLIWVSSKNLSILISFLMVLPVIYRNVFNGINSISNNLKDMATVFKVSKFNKVRYIYLSEVVPYLRTGSSVALGLCWKAGIAAEVIGIPTNSIGEKLYMSKIYLNTADLFAWTVVIIIISICFQNIFLKFLDFIFKKLEIN